MSESSLADKASTSFCVLSLPPGGVGEWQRAEREEAAEQVLETERRRSTEKGCSAAAPEIERSDRRVSRVVSFDVMSDHLNFKIWTLEADSTRVWSKCCISVIIGLMGFSSAASFMVLEAAEEGGFDGGTEGAEGSFGETGLVLVTTTHGKTGNGEVIDRKVLTRGGRAWTSTGKSKSLKLLLLFYDKYLSRY